MDRTIVQTITEFLHTHIQPSFILIFGSFAKGTTHQESDIDIGFYAKDRKIDKYEIFMLAQELAALLKRENESYGGFSKYCCSRLSSH